MAVEEELLQEIHNLSDFTDKAEYEALMDRAAYEDFLGTL